MVSTTNPSRHSLHDLPRGDYGCSEGAAAALRLKRAPDEPKQGTHALSLEDVLAEVDPFLEVIDAREWTECVRHLVFTSMGCAAQERARVATLFKLGFKTEWAPLTDYRGGLKGNVKAYSDSRFYPPKLSLDVFKDRPIPVLTTLVDLLLSAGISAEGDFRDIPDDQARRILYREDRMIREVRTPLDAVISGVRSVERMIYEPVPGEVYNCDILTNRLDYMFQVFEVLVHAGARCRPGGNDPDLPLHAPLRLACTSPWQCGPSSHSGRIFLSLLPAGASLCPNHCALAVAAYEHSAWKVERLLQLSPGHSANDLEYALFEVVERCAKSTEEEEMQINIIRHLVQVGALQKRNTDTGAKSNILSSAIRSGCGLKVVECLISLGANVSPCALRDWVGLRPCSAEVVETLVRNGADVNARVYSSNIVGWPDLPVNNDCTSKVRLCMEVPNRDDRTPLHVYLRYGPVPDVLVVQVLLDAGADPKHCLGPSLERQCPSPEVTRLLVRHGADVNEVDKDGKTPLHHLCERAVDPHVFSQVFEILFAAGVDLNVKNKYGRTPLHIACHSFNNRNGLATCATTLLVVAGADVNARDEKGFSPLHLAVSCAHDPGIPAVIDLLVTAGASVDATDGNGSTPLHLAALHGNALAIERLVDAGADVKLLDLRGGGLFHYAACSPYAFPASFPTAYMLTNLDINLRDHQGRSPLHWAARGSHNWANLEKMLNAGADINARDYNDRTPLHHVARLGTPQIAKRLVSAGADVDAFDQQAVEGGCACIRGCN
ncbi:hypothetical protein BOTBODRAFT_479846 [Botryobasidium botryosum FD-172 SS1]|uniref:Uncharacterized protein n=1 Tax=Botryobasidium botryosum (strain FD-172 SS1) TaxID=930990 RepID=A0A067MTN1_BOTB1|nr:hypothetical protein BOTBODRAFT_479846 [Botryobasidium botryosum FD-172 SS1]